MRSSALSMALAGPLAVRAASSSGTGTTTRYWDCCKPSCAWGGKASVSAPVLTCDAKDNPISDSNAVSGCNGGTAYTCSNNSPWTVNDNLAYGFAATNIAGGSESSWCCSCYALTFTSGAVKGKTMIVQSTNTGGDLGSNQFDLLMPGGGVGIFDGCTSEFGSALPGAQYGGISSESQCSSFPTVLQDGCDWRFEWFQNADNPTVSFERVQCPTAITDKTGCKRDDDGDYPVFSGSSSGSSSNSDAAAVSSKASTQASSKASTQASSKASTQASSKASTQASSKTSTTAAAQETKAATHASAVQSSAAHSSAVQTEAPATKHASTQTASSIQTRTRTRSKSSACAAHKSSGTSKATSTGVSAAEVSTSTVALYQQCNGPKASFPNGALTCASGSTCVYVNDWYSQCQSS